MLDDVERWKTAGEKPEEQPNLSEEIPSEALFDEFIQADACEEQSTEAVSGTQSAAAFTTAHLTRHAYHLAEGGADAVQPVEVLHEWATQNVLDPYPNNKDYDELVAPTRMTKKQVRNWCANSRRWHLPCALASPDSEAYLASQPRQFIADHAKDF